MKKTTSTLITIALILISFSSCDVKNKTNVKTVNIDSLYNKILTDSLLVSGWYYITENNNGFKRVLDQTDEVYFVNPKPILIKEYFEKLEVFETNSKDEHPDYTGLKMQTYENFANIWADATEKSIGKKLGFVINNRLVSVPTVNARIEGGVSSINRGAYTKEDLENFKKELK